MDINFIISVLPLVAILISLAYLFKKPQKTSNLSMATFMPLLAFGIFAYFGNDIAQDENKLFGKTFGLLTLYCVFIVPIFMHLSSAIRQRKKLERQQDSNSTAE